MDNQEIIQVIYSEVKEIRAELQQLRVETADSVSSCRSEVADIKILLIQTLGSHLELLANQETGIEKSPETYVERAYENVLDYTATVINDSLKELQQLKSSTAKSATTLKSNPSTKKLQAWFLFRQLKLIHLLKLNLQSQLHQQRKQRQLLCQLPHQKQTQQVWKPQPCQAK